MTKRKDYGRFVFFCAHDDCDKPAVKHEYGMDRCEDHLADLDPSTWPANQEEKPCPQEPK